MIDFHRRTRREGRTLSRPYPTICCEASAGRGLLDGPYSPMGSRYLSSCSNCVGVRQVFLLGSRACESLPVEAYTQSLRRSDGRCSSRTKVALADLFQQINRLEDWQSGGQMRRSPKRLRSARRSGRSVALAINQPCCIRRDTNVVQ